MKIVRSFSITDNITNHQINIVKAIITASTFLFSVSCQLKGDKIRPVVASISESVYASGIIKSEDQYQAFASVSGIIQEQFVTEGQYVTAGTPLISIKKENQKLNVENAMISASFADFKLNKDKLAAAAIVVDQARYRMLNDSVMLVRQKELWGQQIGTKVQLEERELAVVNSKTALQTAIINFTELKRQLRYNAAQSINNLSINKQQESDFTVKSNIAGIVYNLYKNPGETVGPQTPLALIGKADSFLLELQVDEYDIVKVNPGLTVFVTMDSYRGKVFEARVTKIYPEMNEHTKTFRVEAIFTTPPLKLYPNTTLEANIIIQTRKKALLIPRSYLLNDSVVIRSDGEKLKIKTGLSDYLQVEVISGLQLNDELIKPIP
ncbi:efflux RND transporter periplasmic adaptor subunit [Mucilaginibacter sp. P25]|uniref:Multidrug efflux pump subunit AcrA (Membrane-fusion protein) n=1 Tax=Mucilaginibacter gossypii TaxID=551996 RepID=A0A1G7TYX8_9SPHI|nr:efflux RND transporter periplasmic adaptor subunit [Mucilaginibacter gossypii]SDG39690.1 Multidrug efflux pump subunit AcrA (membrane-fusion protein) [Mucilaginibacter gossypii]